MATWECAFRAAGVQCHCMIDMHQAQGTASASAWASQALESVHERPPVRRRIQYITRPNEEADMEKYRFYVDLPGDLWEDGTFMDLIRMNAAPLVWALAADSKLAQLPRAAAGRWTEPGVQVGCLGESWLFSSCCKRVQECWPRFVQQQCMRAGSCLGQ